MDPIIELPMRSALTQLHEGKRSALFLGSILARCMPMLRLHTLSGWIHDNQGPGRRD